MLRAGREVDVSAPATDTDAAAAVAEQGSEAGRQESTGVQNSAEASDDASVFDYLVLPSARWSKHNFPGHDGVVYCTSVLSSKSEVHSEKVVMFFDSLSKTYCKVFARGILIKESAVETKQVAEEILEAADSMCLCTGAIKCQEYDGALLTQKLKAHAVAHEDVYFSSNCLGQVAKTGTQCVSCRYLRRALLTRRSRVQRTAAKNCKSASLKLRRVLRRNKRLLTRLSHAKEELGRLQEKNATKKEEVLLEQISNLPPRQQEAVKQCFAASKVKPKGVRFTKSWILDCILMKMKSPRLYEHLRKNHILSLPSKSTLKRYVSVYRTVFGFSEKVLKMLKVKAADMDAYKRHGGLLIDELKLSEHLSVKKSGVVEGFVDLGPFTTKKDKSTPSDHGMVILFVPFQGKWSQIIGYFATKGNMKGDTLAKVVIEATILAEKSGLFVDFVTTDGASWNKRMWKIMGIQGTANSVNCKVQHPSDASRHLFFISDFPHLIKCLRNAFLISGFNTPSGHIDMQPVKKAFDIDSSNVTLKVMPGITQSHLQPNNFEKMRVSYAFQLFGTKVLQAFHLFKDKLGSISATQEFFSKIHRLISVMTSRYPAEALRPGSPGTKFLEDFLCYLTEWEKHARAAGGGFISDVTAAGLRVTITSTLELLAYLTEKVGYKFLMTSKLSQDPLENLFGIVRHASKSNDHPTPSQFLVIVNCLSFYGLVKTVSQGNCDQSTLGSLLEVDDCVNGTPCAESEPSPLVANVEAQPSLSASGKSHDHNQHIVRSDNRLIFHIAGYVARKCIIKTGCQACIKLLTMPSPGEDFQLARLTHFCDKGGLLYPSGLLFGFVRKLEDLFTECFSRHQLHADSIIDVLAVVKERLLREIGCPSHAPTLSATIINFYVVARLHFYTKGLNLAKSARRQKAKHLKLSRCS